MRSISCLPQAVWCITQKHHQYYVLETARNYVIMFVHMSLDINCRERKCYAPSKMFVLGLKRDTFAWTYLEAIPTSDSLKILSWNEYLQALLILIDGQVNKTYKKRESLFFFILAVVVLSENIRKIFFTCLSYKPTI